VSSLLEFFASDLDAMIGELPITVLHQGRSFTANRTTLRRDNSLQDGGFMGSVAMTLTAPYNAETQLVNLGDRVSIAGAEFRVISAELAQDGVSVDFALEDINR
jgi:hypothetical protein